MRVISGKYRGKKLVSPENYDIRPTSDKVKGAVFNMLRQKIEGAVFVDLFAGTGAIGIEALSNGAQAVYFAEKDRRALSILKKNLEGINERYEILETDFTDAARGLQRRGIQADVVFADPPYRAAYEGSVTQAAAELLKDDGILVVEHGRDTEVPPNGLVLFNEKRYGITALSLFRKPRCAAVTGTFDPFTEGHKFLVEKALREFDKVYVVLLVNPDKTMKYPLEKRLKIAAESLKEFGEKAVVEAYSGLAVDYARERGASAFIRGFRNDKDLAYEREMADYNKGLSGIPTILYEAERKEISSTEVRTRVESGAAVDGLVSENVIKEL